MRKYFVIIDIYTPNTLTYNELQNVESEWSVHYKKD